MRALLTATALLAIAIGAYALACWVVPFGRCHFCDGSGTRTARITKRLKPCRWCNASGRRLRCGRRAYNYLARVHSEAQTAHRTRERITR